jgi:hypothetical protein
VSQTLLCNLRIIVVSSREPYIHRWHRPALLEPTDFSAPNTGCSSLRMAASITTMLGVLDCRSRWPNSWMSGLPCHILPTPRERHRERAAQPASQPPPAAAFPRHACLSARRKRQSAPWALMGVRCAIYPYWRTTRTVSALLVKGL